MFTNNHILPSEYGCEIALYYILWCLSYEFIGSIVTKNNLFVKIPQEKHIEAKTRIISSCHAIILTLFSCCYLYKLISFDCWTLCLPISGAFGLFDLTIITLYYDNFKKGYLATCGHHLLLIFGPLTMTNQYSNAIAQAYLFEVTVPVLDISWYLYNANMNEGLMFKINSGLAIGLFVVFRVSNSLYLTISVMRGDTMIFFISCCFLALNIYWLKRLINVFIKGIKNN